MSKVIFLDIDGVLNSATWVKNPAFQPVKGERPNWFDPECVKLLNELTDKTGAKFVVSSTWRIGKSVDDLKETLANAGITGEVIAKTGSSSSGIRGVEIYEWMQLNQHIIESLPHLYKDYIILDDDSDFLLWQQHNYFHVDQHVGLTPNVVYKAINFLSPEIGNAKLMK